MIKSCPILTKSITSALIYTVADFSSQVLQQQPDCAHQFYTDASTMIRVDGELSDTASALLENSTGGFWHHSYWGDSCCIHEIPQLLMVCFIPGACEILLIDS